MLDYLEWKRNTTKNPQTVKMYKMWITRFHNFLGYEECHFGLEDVMRFREHLINEVEWDKGNGKIVGYSPKNVQYGMQLLRDYISYQMTVHGFQFPLKMLKIPQERSKSHHPVTYDEYSDMVAILPTNEPISLQRRLMISLLWETGMRGGELLRLRISDLRTREAIIHNEKNHRNRLVSWSEKTEKLLKFYLPLRKNLASKDDFLFVSFKWRPCKKLTTRQLERIVLELCKKAGVKNPIKPHSFRHGFVHWHLQKGTPITTIAQMLGHSTPFNVFNYAQLTGIEIRDAWGLNRTSVSLWPLKSDLVSQ